jgi:hypothetical protein
MEYRYQISYCHPRIGRGGVAKFYTAGESAIEKAQLEALG